MTAFLSTFLFVNRLFAAIFELPETVILLFLGIGLVVAAIAARLWLKSARRSTVEKAEIHLSQHGRNAEAGN